MYTPHTITIFNSYKNDGDKTTYYQPTRLTGVFRQGARAQSTDSNGIVKRGTDKLFIPLTVTAEDGRQYVKPSDFAALTEDERAESWTLNERGDFYIMGTYTAPEDGVIRWDDIRTAHRSGHKILTVKICDYGSDELRHWEVDAE